MPRMGRRVARSGRDRCRETGEVVLVRPPAAGRADETRSSGSRGRRRPPPRGARRAPPARRAGRRPASRPRRRPRRAARAARGSGAACSAARSNAQSGRSVERREQAGEDRAREPARIEAGRALRRLEAARRLVGGLREVARARDPQALRIGDDERAGRIRPAEPLLAGDRQEVEARRRRRGSRRRTGRRRRARARPVRSRSSRTGSRRPLVQSTCESASRRVRGVTAARIASGSGSTRDDARAARVQRAEQAEVLLRRRHDLVLRLQVEPREDDVAAVGRRARRARPAPARRRRARRAPTGPAFAARACARSTPCRTGHRRDRRRAAPAWPRRSAARAGRTSPRSGTRAARAPGRATRPSSGVTRSSSRPGRGPTARRHSAAAARRATPRAAPWSIPATTMWSMLRAPAGRGSRRLKSPASTRGSPVRGQLAREAHARAVSSARGISGPPEVVRRVDVADHEPVEPDGVADAALATGLADPHRAVLERLEHGREQDRVRLAGDARAEAHRIAALEDARRASAAPASAWPPPRERHPAPLLEARQRPERQLLQAEHVRRVAASELDHLLELASGGPAAGCGRGRRFQLRTQHGALAYERMRVVVADPPAFTPPYDHALAAALARAGADVELVTSRFRFGDAPSPTATGAASSSTRSRRGSSGARGCACR